MQNGQKTPCDLLEDKYFVLDAVSSTLSPDVRAKCANLWGLAEKTVARIQPSKTGIYPLREFAGKWWYATVSDTRFCVGAYSTEQIAEFLGQGKSAQAIQGPFDSEGEAEYALDVSWESPD